jgi:dihydroxyacetone kinase-like protein
MASPIRARKLSPGFSPRLRRGEIMVAGAALTGSDVAALVRAASAAISAHADELNTLDAALGDADHGSNMKRGLAAAAERAEILSAAPLADALHDAGRTLVMTVGGASGPLAGTFLMSLAKAIRSPFDAASLAHALHAAADAVAARGRSARGEKTVLDVLYPLADAAAHGRTPQELAAVAEAACQSTIPMKAKRGRAAFLGDRSVGHVDPGARTASILAGVVAGHLDAMRGRAAAS